MSRSYLIAGVAAAAVAVTAIVWAQAPTETPYPSPTVVDLFVAAETLSGPGNALPAGELTNRYKRGETVVFRVFGGQNTTGKILTDKDVRYAYVAVPGQPNLKLAYSAPTSASRSAWTASWKIPADYPTGLVQFKVLFKSLSKQYGSFVQIPVTSAQLTVTA